MNTSRLHNSYQKVNIKTSFNMVPSSLHSEGRRENPANYNAKTRFLKQVNAQ